MGVDATAKSRTVGVSVNNQDFNAGAAGYLPQQIAIIGQGNTALQGTYANTPVQILSAKTAAETFGYGSPIHLAVKQLLPISGSRVGSIPITVYPMDDDGSAVTAAGSIAVTGTTATAAGQFKVKINNIETPVISVASGAAVAAIAAQIEAAIDSVLDMPVITGTITTSTLPLTAKWGGESGNGVYIEIEGTVSGIGFTITQLTSGANNPDVDDMLVLVGNRWETLVINCLNYTDTATLTKYETWGNARWEPTVNRPVLVFTGATDVYTTVATATDARKDEFINTIIAAPGSRHFGFEIAARAIAIIAPIANNNPAQNYYGNLTGLIAGTDGEQFLYASLDATVKDGCSTTLIDGTTIKLNDTVTTYHPDGETVPGYAYVCDCIKLMNIVYNLRNIFEADRYKGAPLLPDADFTVNPTAVQPKTFRTILRNLSDTLTALAITADAEFTKENLTVVINSTNPKRVDVVFPVKLSGNTEIISVDLNFGFFFGSLVA